MADHDRDRDDGNVTVNNIVNLDVKAITDRLDAMAADIQKLLVAVVGDAALSAAVKLVQAEGTTLKTIADQAEALEK